MEYPLARARTLILLSARALSDIGMLAKKKVGIRYLHFPSTHAYRSIE